MFPRITIPFLSLLLFYACTFSIKTQSDSSAITVKQGKSIDSLIREEIRQKNEILLNAIYTKSPKKLNSIKSEALKELTPDEFDNQILKMSDGLDSTDHSIYCEYWVKTSVPRIETGIISNTATVKDTNDFRLTYTSGSDESYVSMLVYRIGYTEMMLLALYGKYDNEWKLDHVSLSNFTVFGYTATEYYYMGKTKYEEGHLLTAYAFSLISQIAIEPGGKIYTYELDAEMRAYNAKVVDEVKEAYHFPISLQNVTSKPEIVGLKVAGTADFAYFPLVSYQTKISLDDTIQLLEESDLVLQELETVLPGFSRAFTNIYLKAYNELPADNEPVRSVLFNKRATISEKLPE